MPTVCSTNPKSSLPAHLLGKLCGKRLWSPFVLYLLVDVGRMVPSATQVSYCLTAAVRNFPSTGLWRFDPHAVSPVCVVVAPTALELQTQSTKLSLQTLQLPSPSSLPISSSGLHSPLSRDSSNLTSLYFLTAVIISELCFNSGD